MIDVLDGLNDFIDSVLDLEFNFEMKEFFGICPIEILYLLLDYNDK